MIQRIAMKGPSDFPPERKLDVTASMAATLVDAHPFATKNDYYYVKAGILDVDPEEKPPMKRGRLLEPVAIELLREEKPDWKIEVPRAYYRNPEWRIGATPDVLAEDEAGEPGVVQIKSVEPSRLKSTWLVGPEIEPPMYSIVQANVEAAMTGASWAAVAALVVGFGIDLHIVPVPIHAGLIDRIKAEVAEFWSRVDRREPYPFDYARDGELIAAQYAEAHVGKIIDLTGDNSMPALAAEDGRLADELKAVKERRGVVRSEILAKIGDAEIALLAGGGRIFAPTIRRKPYQVKAATYRDLRIKMTEART
jgi:YqaJ-like viral recombinase domain